MSDPTQNTFGAGRGGQDALPDPSSLTYEQARDELVETVKILELGQMSLDESLAYWERGEALAKRCEVLLDGAAQRVEAAIGNDSTTDGDGDGGETNADTD
ncbi:exodeoxyribonuclease VII small subunit [Corynebacterium timonense]|uniref:Exodeoxyribonuclease 7 small subunit n=1 Tax=Corynebacterium timonense TaxID=441500 RepID=A0A1H1QL99_9CORY|nr:exodeoxyribonuclease VII small subunit [Corynebacterium timonense]SDS24230.1 Exodeoxyribonuclease VII small subunit [Corynebacterium timonense]